ncbi:MAG: hypothetical protein IPK50_10985 [Fibrobacterota bacterium]|nr:hypothetical protein [Fibrobacterota bacterium]QQS07402.1 MAG: hypothetical protein IPK50_10985 [Fibrobacterota bacterium]
MGRRNGDQVLGIALLRGRLHARVFDEGKVVAGWDYPDPVAGLQGLEEVLEEMGSVLEFHGGTVVVAISSSQVAHHSLKIPPMGEPDLLAYLGRKARIESAGADRPCWGWRPLRESLKGEKSVLLQVLPEAMVDVFLRFCDRRGHEIELILPVSGSLLLAASKLPIPPGSWVLMAGEAENATTVVLVQPSGDLALVRELPYGWSDGVSLERVGRELHRSLLFAKQQFGVVAQEVWLLGSRTEECVEPMSKLLDVPVKARSTEDPPAQWLEPLVDAPWTLPDNLVPESRRKLRRARKWLIAGVVAILLVDVGVGSLWTLSHRRQKGLSEEVGRMALETRTAALLNERAELEKVLAQRDALILQTSHLDSACKRPLAGWLHGWLGRNLPPEMALSRTSIGLDSSDGRWKVELVGAGPRDPVEAAAVFGKLQGRIDSLVPGWKTVVPWTEKWHAEVLDGSNLAADTAGCTFRVEGVVP